MLSIKRQASLGVHELIHDINKRQTSLRGPGVVY